MAPVSMSRATFRRLRQAVCVAGLLVLAASAVIVAPASAQIARYEFPGSSFTPTVTTGGVTATPINAAGSGATLEPGVALPDSVFLIPNSGATNAADAVALDRYMQFSVTPLGGATMSLTNLTFDAGRGGSSTPRGWVLRSSVDGFGTTIATQTVDTQQPTLSSFFVDLSATPFQSLSAATTFRFYGFAPSSGQGIFFDNITLNGTTTEQVLANYEFPGSTFAPTSTAANVTASSLGTAGSGATLEPGVALPDSVFLIPNSGATNAADAVALDRFFEFSVTADEGYALSLSRLTFDAARGGSSTPRGWVLRSSVDGFSADISSALVETIQPTLSGFEATFQDPSFLGLSGTTTFRLYGFAPSSGQGIFFDNLRVRGTTVLTAPEPGTLFLLALCGLPLAVGAACRRCRRIIR